MIDDLPVYGALSVRLEQAGYFRASRFCVTMAMGAPPLLEIVSYAGLSQKTITIEMASEPLGFTSLLTGQIDNVTIDCAAQCATLTGRDLSARMIDTEIAEAFVNQTASQIVAAIAGRHGLSADIAPTTAIVGQYYQLDHARSSLQLHSRAGNEWDLLVWLAQNENFYLNVTATTLYFGPLPVIDPVVIAQENCMDLSIDIALTIPAAAKVMSWNTRNKAVVMQTAGSGAVTTNLVRPNLSSTQALNLANSQLAALGRHVTVLEMRLSGELALTPGTPIYLNGTQSSLDQIYMIDEITRELDIENGFVETIRAHAVN
jgi:phage protein D